MTVNPFWFGFFVGIIVTIVVLIVVSGALNSWGEDRRYEDRNQDD